VFKTSTIVSDMVEVSGTNLSARTPEAVEVVTDDLTGRWLAGQVPPAEIEIKVGPPGAFSLHGDGSGTAAPE
jgi:hypothetical protein